MIPLSYSLAATALAGAFAAGAFLAGAFFAAGFLTTSGYSGIALTSNSPFNSEPSFLIATKKTLAVSGK